MPVVLDQTQDLDGRELYRMTQQYPLPPFCKQASSEVVCGAGNAYAYPSRKLYPCDTAVATYISAMYFLDKKAEFAKPVVEYIEKALAKYAAYHGIGERVEQLKQAYATAQVPVADDLSGLDDDDFALLMDGERHYPLRNGHEIKAAAAFLQRNVRIIPLEYRQKIASRILTKANATGADLGGLDSFLDQQAGHGYCSSVKAAEMLFDRARLLKRAGKLDVGIQMAAMAKSALMSKEAIHDDEHRRQLAAIVDRVDREQGLHQYVDDLTPPESVLFMLTEKVASDLRNAHVNTLTGSIYKRADLGRLKLDDIRDFMGDSFADAITSDGLSVSPEKLAAVVPTLPLPDSKLFDKMSLALGVRPVARERAQAPEGLSTEELLALAGVG